MTAASVIRRAVATILLSIGLAILWSGDWYLAVSLVPLVGLLAYLYPR